LVLPKSVESEKKRARAEALDQDTGEDDDEPLDPPPPPPPPAEPLGTETWLGPMPEDYVNPETGEKRQFDPNSPPDPEKWIKVRFDLHTGRWNVRWWWVRVAEADIGKEKWKGGWVLSEPR
jgi:hypothetical protein